MKKQPVLITDAARSQGDQLRSREIRYVTMMGIRALCLILGGVLISLRVPLLALWLILCAAGMVFLPWAAVLIANDRPPKSKAERAADAAAREDYRRALIQAAAAEQTTPEPIIIDAEIVETNEPAGKNERRPG
ncbi:hypothetical protein AMIS_68640 [Actinoplanes missouriensis 431]|uniref:DUF3099 domain-containing protein n=1 Tax=Actinoplanes missouriensis (strain ATCC 14538 / DSM 43046 / CBS 188.64 / JCM 3121 / NBRC 102363 / NCIMB 12654 / NRRL B-3342 / UNCC 431) TaxID=512565 RepID=I0HGE7_ACTM4|nr:DUF3099 domain-containing protein [Actinoplanes missouriensis]BAL92084.1 hypothetical protein AMIS_68640 [Actinoplanes missouriensis 431]